MRSVQRKKITPLPKFNKALSATAAQRIERNFERLKEMQMLRKPPRIISVSRVNYPLPDINGKTPLHTKTYADHKSASDAQDLEFLREKSK